MGRRPRRLCKGSLILGFQRACLVRDQDDKRARWGTEPLDVSQRWAIFSISEARSPIMMQGAIVLPVVTRGIMEPSAIRIIDPVNLERAVHHRHRVVSHLGRTRLMPITACCVTYKVLQCSAFEIAGHHLPLDERAQRT